MTPSAQSIQMSKNPDSPVLREDTKIVVSGRDPHRFDGMVNPPVYHVSTVLAETVEQLNSRDQAEDGIRDRSPSRGLGDVYKRQSLG